MATNARLPPLPSQPERLSTPLAHGASNNVTRSSLAVMVSLQQTLPPCFPQESTWNNQYCAPSSLASKATLLYKSLPPCFLKQVPGVANVVAHPATVSKAVALRPESAGSVDPEGAGRCINHLIISHEQGEHNAGSGSYKRWWDVSWCSGQGQQALLVKRNRANATMALDLQGAGAIQPGTWQGQGQQAATASQTSQSQRNNGSGCARRWCAAGSEAAARCSKT